MSEETRIQGELVGFTFKGEESGFAVARLKLDSGEEHTVVGPISHLVPGQSVRLSGRWQDHPSYGRQFRAQSFLVDDPRTLEGLRAYLGSGVVRGVGSEMARRLVDHFGLDILRILAENPDRLLEVSGIGAVTVEKIRSAYSADVEHREMLASLRGYGMGAALARRVVDRYGAEAPSVVARDPFRLAREVPGIGFRSADGIARQVGIARDDPRRVEAAIRFLLDQGAEEEGHCFIPEETVREKAKDLDIPDLALREGIRRMIDAGHLLTRETADPRHRPLQIPWLAAMERKVASRLVALASRIPGRTLITVADAERAVGILLDPEQRWAVEQGLCHHRG